MGSPPAGNGDFIPDADQSGTQELRKGAGMRGFHKQIPDFMSS
jgi:hypothetical protein